MSRPALPLTAGAFLLTAAALTGCSASDTPAAPETSTVTQVVTETVTAPAVTPSAPAVAADGSCALDQPGARAIVVQGDQFDVIGKSYAVIYSDQPVAGASGRFFFMGAGDRFDMKARKATRRTAEWRPLEGVRPPGAR